MHNIAAGKIHRLVEQCRCTLGPCFWGPKTDPESGPLSGPACLCYNGRGSNLGPQIGPRKGTAILAPSNKKSSPAEAAPKLSSKRPRPGPLRTPSFYPRQDASGTEIGPETRPSELSTSRPSFVAAGLQHALTQQKPDAPLASDQCPKWKNPATSPLLVFRSIAERGVSSMQQQETGP